MCGFFDARVTFPAEVRLYTERNLFPSLPILPNLLVDNFCRIWQKTAGRNRSDWHLPYLPSSSPSSACMKPGVQNFTANCPLLPSGDSRQGDHARNSGTLLRRFFGLAALTGSIGLMNLGISTAAPAADAASAAISARPLTISEDGTVVAPSQLSSVTSPDMLPESDATLTIDVHPEWCHLDATVASNAMAQKLSYLVGDMFARRCYSDDLKVDSSASGRDLPFSLERLTDVLDEIATANRPIRLEWFADDHRLVLSGESFGNVSRVAIELRLRMAMSKTGTTVGDRSIVDVENRISVVDAPRTSSSMSDALGTVIARDFAGANLPMLTEVQLHPIYFSRRDGRVDAQEMPKLVDVVDQLSTLRPIEECPPLIISGYILPGATSRRNVQPVCGVPSRCAINSCSSASRNNASLSRPWKKSSHSVLPGAAVG